MYGSHTAVCVSVVLGMISVSIRRARRGKRMMKVESLLTVDQVQFFISQEDELSQADTVSTVMEIMNAGLCTNAGRTTPHNSED